MAKNNMLGMFPARTPPKQTANPGSAGYDNMRENIDPHIKTRVIESQEAKLGIVTDTELDNFSNIIHADNLHVEINAQETVDKGMPVYASGFDSGNNLVKVKKADSNGAETFPAMGVMNEDVAAEATGQCTVYGVVQDHDTSAWDVGDSLYLSSTPGVLTNVRPTADDEQVQAIAKVLRKHASFGVLLIQGAGRTNDIPNNFGKTKMTTTGGFAILLTNKTGGATVQGQLVIADVNNNDAVVLTDADNDECFGVFLESGKGNNEEVWVVVSGIADVAMEDNTAATRGNWVRTSITEAGYADATNATTPAPASFTHFNEIGHCIETVAAGGIGTHILARCVLHFN